jgi:hypothetical protein
MRPSLSLVAVAALMSLPGPAAAAIADSQGAPPPTVTAALIGERESIRLDGTLDEPVWERADPATDFVQIDPDNGAPATEQTEVRVAFDAETLYLGVICHDSEPTKWLGYQRRRDEFLQSDDRFQWTIDTFLDGRSGYFFEMNPSGLMGDALFGVNGSNRQWDGIWDARVRHSDVGWTIEIAIPFRTLNFDPHSDTWGVNFQRTVRRKNEDSIWSGWARNQGLQRMTNAGRLVGLHDLSQGHGLDLKPYGVVTSGTEPALGVADRQNHAAAGADVFYNPTPGLRANLTLNTDFAQTEVDQRQVNLTQFSLFFPEKRDFFLDGATYFDFAQPGGDQVVTPFFSRRIGLTSAGEPQKIDYGTKLTGQVGQQDVGFLHVRTADAGALDGEDFTVARVKRRVLQQSYVGAIYTRRASGLTAARQTAGLDFRFATSSFRGSSNLAFSGWMMRAPHAGASGAGSAFGATLDYPNDRWDVRVDAFQVERNFDPAVGFLTRNDYRRYLSHVFFGPRPRDSRIVRKFVTGAEVDVQTDLRNDVLVGGVTATLLEAQFQSQDTVGVDLITRHRRLDAPFAISSHITLPEASRYDYARYRLRAQTANRRVVAVGGKYEFGGFYSGTRRQEVADITLRLRPGYIVYLNTEWNDVRLAEGHFTSNVYRIVGETQFTPFAALVNTVQYDNVSRVMGWQSRFRWIVHPGNDIYLVYTRNWLDDPLERRFVTQDTRLASKILYTYRF